MQEEFLHYLWKYRLFDNNGLQTTDGEELQIIKPGEHNTDSGPDFFNARIKIGKTTWAGNVEIHTRASDWHRHKHTSDKAYNNIILHVVHAADAVISRKNGEEIPALELKTRIPKIIYDKYLRFANSKDNIPCSKQISGIDPFLLNNWLDRMLAERLERKSLTILETLKLNKNNWEETFYQLLARNFGFKVNAEPFALLAKALPYSVLGKHRDSRMQLEALLLGTAGLLNADLKEEYPNSLKKEFAFLKQKFKLKPFDAHLWKFSRMHPPNFPTIRIAQFAGLIHHSSRLFSNFIEAKNTAEIKKMLDCEASEYWKNHYRFDAVSHIRRKTIGAEAISNIIINTIAPFMFTYGRHKGSEAHTELALKLLESIASEDNTIIRSWEKLGIRSESAFQTQALIQLKNEYCTKKRCLECAVGAKLLSPS